MLREGIRKNVIEELNEFLAGIFPGICESVPREILQRIARRTVEKNRWYLGGILATIGR